MIKIEKEYSQEIDDLKKAELEKIKEKYLLTKEGRIKFYGVVVDALMKSIGFRRLSESNLPTPKLLELLLKYREKLEKEVEKIETEPDKSNLDYEKAIRLDLPEKELEQKINGYLNEKGDIFNPASDFMQKIYAGDSNGYKCFVNASNRGNVF